MITVSLKGIHLLLSDLIDWRSIYECLSKTEKNTLIWTGTDPYFSHATAVNHWLRHYGAAHRTFAALFCYRSRRIGLVAGI